MFSLDDYTLAGAVVTVVVGTPVTFYITHYLEERSKFKKFKAKLDAIAGVGSKLLWQSGAANSMHFTTDIFTVLEITREGLVLQNDLHKIFVPIEKVLETEIVRPSENYEQLRRQRMKQEFTVIMDSMVDPLITKLKEVLVRELLNPETELSAVVGVQILGQLKDSGIDTSKVEMKQPTLARLLAEVNSPKTKAGPPPTVEAPAGSDKDSTPAA
jgi:hypothetical protein